MTTLPPHPPASPLRFFSPNIEVALYFYPTSADARKFYADCIAFLLLAHANFYADCIAFLRSKKVDPRVLLPEHPILPENLSYWWDVAVGYVTCGDVIIVLMNDA